MREIEIAAIVATDDRGNRALHACTQLDDAGRDPGCLIDGDHRDARLVERTAALGEPRIRRDEQVPRRVRALRQLLRPDRWAHHRLRVHGVAPDLAAPEADAQGRAHAVAAHGSNLANFVITT
jgi:hypothetical protein